MPTFGGVEKSVTLTKGAPALFRLVLGVAYNISRAVSTTISLSLPTRTRSHFRVVIGNYNMEALSSIHGEYIVGVASSGTNQVVPMRTPTSTMVSLEWDGSSIVATMSASSYYMMIAYPIYYVI